MDFDLIYCGLNTGCQSVKLIFYYQTLRIMGMVPDPNPFGCSTNLLRQRQGVCKP